MTRTVPGPLPYRLLHTVCTPVEGLCGLVSKVITVRGQRHLLTSGRKRLKQVSEQTPARQQNIQKWSEETP